MFRESHTVFCINGYWLIKRIQNTFRMLHTFGNEQWPVCVNKTKTIVGLIPRM